MRHHYKLRFSIIAISAVILGGSAALSQDFKPKPLTLDGKDYGFNVLTTPDGKPYGYFVPQSRWAALADGSTIIFVCWENYSTDFEKLMPSSSGAGHMFIDA
jgi:hypothetical protein